MSLVGCMVLFDDQRTQSCEEWIVVQHNQDTREMTLVNSRANPASFRPRVVRDGIDGEVVTAERSVVLIKDVMVQIAMSLESDQVARTKVFTFTAFRTIELLKDALDVTVRRIGDSLIPNNLTGKCLSVIGPNNLTDKIIVLHDHGHDMVVVPADPRAGAPVMEAAKCEWVIYQVSPGTPALESLLAAVPDAPPVLHQYLQRWTAHQWN